MTHLVLGSAGQVGKLLCQVLRDNGESVITYDVVDSPIQDLRKNRTDLFRFAYMSDYVHFLAYDVGGSVYLEKYQNTKKFLDNNMKIMLNTFDVLEDTKKPFTFASSQMSNMSYSNYGVLKSIGEKYTKVLNGLVVKFWNVYGVEHDEEKSHVITDFIKMAMNDGVIKMRTTGEEERQFLYGYDSGECLLQLHKNYDMIDRNKELHCTNHKWISIMELAQIIAAEFPGCKIIPGEKTDTVQKDKRNEPDDYILNLWQPKTDIRDGIKEIIKVMVK